MVSRVSAEWAIGKPFFTEDIWRLWLFVSFLFFLCIWDPRINFQACQPSKTRICEAVARHKQRALAQISQIDFSKCSGMSGCLLDCFPNLHYKALQGGKGRILRANVLTLRSWRDLLFQESRWFWSKNVRQARLEVCGSGALSEHLLHVGGAPWPGRIFDMWGLRTLGKLELQWPADVVYCFMF